ncbi:MAG: tRNA pseudouridine(55) synthase TruB [Bacteroidales bacterium]|jgi:tRNA pseudouridine55 synthase|nr:tRNA pseudouridine(55) synthase TruB [Bacteroidales bacterium]
MQQNETLIHLFNPDSTVVEDFITGQVILIDKPLWWTSFDVVRKCRNLITHKVKIKKLKVGHAGTLDPLATGLMIVCSGKATKRINEWTDMDKEYIATLELGRTTLSCDLETETNAVFPFEHITREMTNKALESFLGVTQQVPPLFSAKYVQGKRAYTLARQGSDIELPPNPVNISSLEIIRFELPVVEIKMRCSKGTYVRAFARDLGASLQSGACLTALRRTAVGCFHVDDALSPELFEQVLKNINSNESITLNLK